MYKVLNDQSAPHLIGWESRTLIDGLLSISESCTKLEIYCAAYQVIYGGKAAERLERWNCNDENDVIESGALDRSAILTRTV